MAPVRSSARFATGAAPPMEGAGFERRSMASAAMKRAWNDLASATPRRLTELFDAEPDRLERLTIEQAGILFDLSKTHLDRALVERFVGLADAAGFAEARSALLRGDPINVTEGRAAE